MYYGWRGKIGIIFPCIGIAPEYEFHKYAPEGVSILTQRVYLESIDPKGLIEMGEHVIDAAKLLAYGNPDIIVFACTSGSFIKGLGYDLEIIKEIEEATGIKAITTSTSIVKALQTMGIKKLVMTTPYVDEVNDIEVSFMQDSGFEVLDYSGLGLQNSNSDRNNPNQFSIQCVTPDIMYNLTKSILHPDADGILISCTGIGIVEGIKLMEKDFNRPVVTSNQCTLWHALRSIGINDEIELGELFKY
jgi:maleate isomerase